MDTQQFNLLATVSHELRTPLNAIAGWVQLLRSKRLDEAKSAYAFKVIEQSIKAQAILISDLMDVCRIINGQFRLQMQEVDIETIIKSAVDDLQPLAEEKRLQVSVNRISKMSRVAADPFRLQQVVWNLLSNAIKFTPACGSVCVELNCNDSDLEIKVTDSGQGIELEFLPFVFDRFRQAENTASDRKAGLGLGLAIVREIVSLHHGSISAYSEGLGRGAAFNIRLPLKAAEPPGSKTRSDN